ncbi:SH3 domain-containing protein [uncultured Cedecea sp.]|uniref:SH3 domain-containing protein n=1 Tax=uncultured Cedecea sp. TaxID=988762 RepID=UPI002620CAC0|nr:SH3 domain-containing protein [uncultured Cedecea sp.]
MKDSMSLKLLKPVFLTVILFLSACSLKDSQQSSTPQSAGQKSDSIDSNKTYFPLGHYPQEVEYWIPTAAKHNDLSVINQTQQRKYFSYLLSKYYGTGEQDKSPWNASYIAHILKNKPENNRDASIRQLLSPESLSWGANFRQNSARWKNEIRNNSMGAISTIYQASSRAITVRATLVRALPTEQPAYHDPRRAGEGYPFDYLQMSAIQPATPVYILTDSQDKAWRYVISPGVTGWVKSEDIATVSPAFVNQWTTLAMKNAGTFIQQPVSVHQGKQFYFLARPGTILPFEYHRSGYFSVLIPVRKADGRAMIKSVSLHQDVFTAMPWPMTRTNIATLMKSMSGLPYGWGNTLFYNDCSSELRNLMMPFGILLPRNSAAQIKATARLVDLSKESLQDRIAYLEKHGKAFTTLIYLPGHIMLYIGNSQINGKSVPMTYQNLWALRPENAESRSIIGSSVFFPLLSVYPEKPEMVSLADKKEFKLGFLESGDDNG